MTHRQAEIADLYYHSNSIQFGEFLLSAHRDNPSLPPSPWYMHYPKQNEPGSELLPELHECIGEEFYEICQRNNLKVNRIAALPRGAWPLGEALAKQYTDYPENLLTFDKVDDPEHGTTFTEPEGTYEVGDELIVVDDHTSGGRNKFRFLRASRAAGLVVSTVLTVVDRQQGARDNLQKVGVGFLSILTADDLLGHGITAGYITPAQVEEIQQYRQQNQL